MSESPQEEDIEKLPDRPLECSECKKPIVIRYTEIEKGVVTETSMCADCPHLQRCMGAAAAASNLGAGDGGKGKIACGECGTTLDQVRVGHPLGCAHCYEVFNDIIISELTLRNKIPLQKEPQRKSAPLHVGRGPGEAVEMSASLKLIALNEALNETLKREDYEQAAMIRDQINALAKVAEVEKVEGNDVSK